MTSQQKDQLILAMTSRGHSYTSAYNEANGSRADELFKEYCSDPIDNFFARWMNKGINVDKAFGNQCVDLMHQYLNDVYGLDRSILASSNAKTVFTNFANMKGNKYFTKIVNKWWLVPQKGDIIFFGNGESGHVCIFKEGNIWSFISFDQNWPAQGYWKKGVFIGTGTPHFQKHNYSGCIGWLRPTGINKL